MRHTAKWIAQHEFWLCWIYGIPLVLSSNFGLVFAAALAAIPFFWVARRVARGAWTVATPLDVPILVLLLLGLASAVVSIQPGLGWRMYAELGGGVALYYSIVNGLYQRDLMPGVWVTAVLALSMGVVGLLGLQYSTKLLPGPLLFQLLPKFDFAFLNPRGFTPNIVAGAIAPALPICFGWALGGNMPRPARLFLLAASLGLLLVVLLTQSRGAIVGLVGALAIFLSLRERRLLWSLPIAIIALAGLVAWQGTDRLFELLIAGDSTGIVVGRRELWSRALYILHDFPFTGIGLGSYSQAVSAFYPLFLNDPGAPLPHAHNLFLQMGVDFGIGGFVAFIGFAISALGVGWQNLKRRTQIRQAWLPAALLAGWVVFLLHGLVDDVLVSTKVAVIIWLVLALMMSLPHQGARRA